MNNRLRAFVWFLAFSATVLRATLPAGWMPVADGSGGASLVICTGHGPLAVPVHSRGHAPPVGRSNDICPFAAIAHLATPTPFALLPAPIPIHREADPGAYGRPIYAARPRGNHTSRAPPALA